MKLALQLSNKIFIVLSADFKKGIKSSSKQIFDFILVPCTLFQVLCTWAICERKRMSIVYVHPFHYYHRSVWSSCQQRLPPPTPQAFIVLVSICVCVLRWADFLLCMWFMCFFFVFVVVFVLCLWCGRPEPVEGLLASFIQLLKGLVRSAYSSSHIDPHSTLLFDFAKYIDPSVLLLLIHPLIHYSSRPKLINFVRTSR
jgi:hypothetical protein